MKTLTTRASMGRVGKTEKTLPLHKCNKEKSGGINRENNRQKNSVASNPPKKIIGVPGF